MNEKKNFFGRFLSKSNSINGLIGIALLISLLIVFQNPNNKFAIITASTTAGLLNMMNGFKLMKDPKKKTTAASYLLMGVILIAFGFFITQHINIS